MPTDQQWRKRYADNYMTMLTLQEDVQAVSPQGSDKPLSWSTSLAELGPLGYLLATAVVLSWSCACCLVLALLSGLY